MRIRKTSGVRSTCVAVLVLAGGIGACGDDEGSGRSARESEEHARTATASGDEERHSAAGKAVRGEGSGGTGTKQRFTPGRTIRQGKVVLRTPPRPTLYETDPSRGCVVEIVGGRRVTRPPTPGLSARRAGRNSVIVSYRFRSLPARCRPISLHVGVDVNGDLSGSYSQVALVEGKEGNVAIELPEAWAEADVANAGARTNDRALGKFTSVLIR
jgi:hypothetical protein